MGQNYTLFCNASRGNITSAGVSGAVLGGAAAGGTLLIIIVVTGIVLATLAIKK